MANGKATGVTPWYATNQVADREHRAHLAYRQAVASGFGVLAARTALLTAMRAYEGEQRG